MSDVNLSYQEQQLIWIIREQSGGDDLRLQLWYGDGLWRVSMDAATGGKAVSGNGVGETFDRAWEDLAPDAYKRSRLSVVSTEPAQPADE